MQKLEALLPHKTTPIVTCNPSAVIYDGHVVIQMLPVPTNIEKITFEHMAPSFLNHILVTPSPWPICPCPTVPHPVFDRYDVDSIKR